VVDEPAANVKKPSVLVVTVTFKSAIATVEFLVITVIAEPEEVTVTCIPAGFVTVDIASVDVAALAGTTLSSPRPSAETATSAIFLIVVFVDISFLSECFVRYQTFQYLAFESAREAFGGS